MRRRRITYDGGWQFRCPDCGWHIASGSLPWMHDLATRHRCTPLDLSPVAPDVHISSGDSAPMLTYASIPDQQMSWHGIRTPLEVW